MSNLSRRSAEIDRVFRRSFGAIRFALLGLYRLSEDEAGEVAENLYVWFERFAARGSSHEIPADALRLPLLAATCRVGLTAQLTKLDGKVTDDAGLGATLARAPEDVAWDLESKLKSEEAL